MAKKKAGAVEPAADITESIRVTVSRAHCLTPHSIELRMGDDGNVVDARTEDWKHVHTIGAKTIEHIFTESGVELPSNDTDRFEVVISPYTGEVVAIERTESVAKASSTEITETTDSTEPPPTE